MLCWWHSLPCAHLDRAAAARRTCSALLARSGSCCVQVGLPCTRIISPYLQPAPAPCRARLRRTIWGTPCLASSTALSWPPRCVGRQRLLLLNSVTSRVRRSCGCLSGAANLGSRGSHREAVSKYLRLRQCAMPLSPQVGHLLALAPPLMQASWGASMRTFPAPFRSCSCLAQLRVTAQLSGLLPSHCFCCPSLPRPPCSARAGGCWRPSRPTGA